MYVYELEHWVRLVRLHQNISGTSVKKDHPDLNILIYDRNKDHVVEWAKTIYSDSAVWEELASHKSSLTHHPQF